MLTCTSVINQFVELDPPTLTQSSTTPSEQPVSHSLPVVSKPDLVNAYARNLLSLGLLLMELNDGVREGDGERVIRCWRYYI